MLTTKIPAGAKLTNLLLFVFDLNNLKYYNDKFGHDCGDQYITDAVHILQKVFSRYGKLYRIGGDEFCVLIDDHNTCDISHLISCLRKEEAVYNASSRNIHLQIACGYAVFDPRTDADLDALQKRADQNMYENKKQLKTFFLPLRLKPAAVFLRHLFTEFLYLIQLLVRKRKCIRKTVLIARL